MQSNDRIRVQHILNEAGEACKYAEGMSFDEFVEDGKPDPECEAPPRLIVYVPKTRSETDYALEEAEYAGVVMEPGANPWQRNTRLRVVAEQVFKKIAPDSVQDIGRQIDEGILSLSGMN